MFKSVRDTISLLEYRSVVSEQFMQVATTMVKNYGEVPAFIEPHARRPELAMFDGEVYIMGAAQDLPFHCAYMKLNPSTEYAVSVYTDEEAARERAISVFGADPEEVLALASMTQPETVAEELLEDGDLMEARFSRASNKQSLKSRADNPLNRFRTVSNISNVIKTSIVGFDAKKVNKAPLLIGHSGISKSASVKSVIKELNSSANEAAGDWGYRLVDIRAAFFDKMDMLGMITLTSETDGSDGSLLSQMNERWTDSPKLELLTCTTPFVESCRSMVQRIDSGEVTVSESDKEFEARLREYAKTPVMFFDEINRTPKEVMNQLMVMINGHALNDYDISIAPKLAAANLPVEMDKLDELDPEQYEKLIYLVQNVDDVAKVDRFIPYVVSSSDPSIQKGAFDYLVELEAVQKHPQLQELARFGFDQQSLHDISAMDGDGKFPTFRGWEDTMTYLAWCLENNELPYRQVISGILGATTAGGVLRWLESSGIEVDITTTDSESFIDHTYRAGLPLMLLGRMGIAKTAGINQAIKKNDDEAIRIDLSSTDRVNVGGFPRPAPFLREAFGFGFKEKGAASKEDALNAKMAAVTSPLFEAFEAEVKQNGDVPHQTTSYIPNKQLQDQLDAIRESQEEGKRLVLVFDEINRCTPVVQSAVFEAISDSRLFGCDLSGINYSVIAAGNYDDSEGFDAESGSMGSTFDAAPIDTATLHRFATKITREVSLRDTEQFIEYLETELPAAHYVAEKMGAETLMELLNTPYDEMGGDDYDDENEGGLASPVFTMRTLQALHNMMVTNHPYVYANIALSEAAVAAGGADPVLAQAQAFIAVSENPDLILFKEDPNMGYPLRELKSTGLHTALELPNTSTVAAKDIFNAIRDVCISITNGDMETISRLKDQFGNLNSFMFRCQAVIEEIENTLDDASVQLTYAGIVPDYAKDVVGEALEQFYVEKSVAAAQVAGFEPLELFNESASDEELEGLINRHMAMVASETTLDFNELFIRLLEDTLAQNPDLKPSAAHLLRLKNVYNGHPLAAARPITDARISMFLNDYRNKVSGAEKAVETLNKLVVDMLEVPKIITATSLIFKSFANSIGERLDNANAIETVVLPAISSGTDVYKKAVTNENAKSFSWNGDFKTVKDATNYLADKGISPLQAAALLGVMMEARGSSTIDAVGRFFEDNKRFELMSVGSVNAHDGHIYPDYNTLHRFSQSKGNYAGTTIIGKSSKAYALSLKDVLPLSRIDNASRNTEAAKENPDWFLDLVYKGNRYGVAITLRVEDAIAVPQQQLLAIPVVETPSVTGLDGDQLRRIALAVAQVTMDGTPARPTAFMGDEGAGNLGALANLSEDDLVHSATFAQINYEATFVKQGGTKEVDQLQALDLLRSPSALASDDSHDFTDTQIVMAGIANTRSMGVLADEDKVSAKVSQSLRDTFTSLSIDPSVVIDDDVSLSVSERQQQLVNKDMIQAFSRYSRLLRDVWK
ncbi:MAG: hypothetical protein GY833_22030 [Aestuariibacter sp.]|nr:hypothetical protein [Aestuariibacter sp.]